MILKLIIILTLVFVSESTMFPYYFNKLQDEIIKDYMFDPSNFNMDVKAETMFRNKMLWKIKYIQRNKSLYERIKKLINYVYEDFRRYKATRWCGPGNDFRDGIELYHANKTDACFISVKSGFCNPKKLLTYISYKDSIPGEMCNLKIDEKYRFTV